MSKAKVNGQRPEPTDDVSTLRRRLDEATEREQSAEARLEAQRRSFEAQVSRLETQVDNQARCIEGCTDELERLRKNQPPVHVVRAFERGARAERKRALEQARISALQWGGNTEVRRALDTFLAELRDERLPLPEFKP